MGASWQMRPMQARKCSTPWFITHTIQFVSGMNTMQRFAKFIKDSFIRTRISLLCGLGENLFGNQFSLCT